MRKRFLSRVSVLSLAAMAALGAASQDCQARFAGTVSSGSFLTFTSDSQSVWGPGQSLDGFTSSFDLFDVSVPRTSPSYGNKVGLWGGTFGGILKPTMQWSMGLSGRLHDFDSGAVQLEWPAEVTLTVDEPNSYAPGDTIIINSQYRVPDSGHLTATPPRFELDLQGNIALDFSASLEGCLGTCGRYDIFPHRSFKKDFTLLRLGKGGLSFPDLPPQRSYAVPHLMSWCESAVTNVGGFLDFPNGYPQLPGTTAYIKACSDAGTPVDFSGGGKEFTIEYKDLPARSGDRREVFQRETSYRFLDISVDLDGLVDPTNLLGNDTPTVGGVSGSYDLLDVSSDLDLTYRQTLRFEPTLKMRIDFPQPMTFRVANGAWQSAASALLTVGEPLELRLAGHSAAPWNAANLYLLDNTFTSTTRVEPAANVNYSAAKIEAHLPAVSGFAENIMKEVCTCPDWDVTGLICLASKVCGPVLDYVAYHDYGKVDISAAFVDGKEVAGYSTAIPLRSYTGTLEGISPRAGTPITIDPEDPQLQLQAEVSRVINHGGGRRTVIYSVSADNAGDVPLKNLMMRDSLAEAFAAAQGFTVPARGLRSCDLTINPVFSSASAGELLVSPIVLDDGRDPNPAPVAQLTGGTLQLEIDVWPGLYPKPFVNVFKAAGNSWLRGTPLVKEARATVDLGPARLETLSDFAVYADKKVLMKQPARIKGSVGSNDAVEIQNGSYTLIAGDIRSLGTVDVHGAITVDYVFTNSLLNLTGSGTVNGRRYFDLNKLKEVNEYVTPVLRGFELPPLAFESEGPALTITAKTNGMVPYQLASGAYGAVTVAAGAKLLLRIGENGQSFSFKELTLEDGATVLFDVSAAPVSVNVSRGVKIGRNVKMGFDPLTGSTREVSFNIAGPGQISIGANAQLIGTWLAPSAAVTLGPDSRITGAVYADMVMMERGSKVEYHEEPWLGNIYQRQRDSCAGKATASGQ